MSEETLCPACGSPAPAGAAACPACGSALAVSSSAPTIIAAAPRFSSSAEAMDEVKRLLRAGSKAEAARVHGEYFNLAPGEAQQAVDAIESDLKFSAPPPSPVTDDQPPAFAQPEAPATPVTPAVIDAPAAGRPAWQKWLLGCGVALVLFCCLCVLLPIIVFVATGQGR